MGYFILDRLDADKIFCCFCNSFLCCRLITLELIINSSLGEQPNEAVTSLRMLRGEQFVLLEQ
jgi:hypothetical protein